MNIYELIPIDTHAEEWEVSDINERILITALDANDARKKAVKYTLATSESLSSNQNTLNSPWYSDKLVKCSAYSGEKYKSNILGEVFEPLYLRKKWLGNFKNELKRIQNNNGRIELQKVITSENIELPKLWIEFTVLPELSYFIVYSIKDKPRYRRIVLGNDTFSDLSSDEIYQAIQKKIIDISRDQ